MVCSFLQSIISPSFRVVPRLNRRLPSIDILRAMSEAIALVSRRAQQHDPLRAHARVRSFYDWAAVAARTEKVYEAVVMAEEMGIWERIGRWVFPLSAGF